MTQNEKNLLIKDLCARLPYGVILNCCNIVSEPLTLIDYKGLVNNDYDIDEVKPYLFPLSSMTDEDYAIYSKIWEDTGKTAYLEGCHHLISTIKAYKAANDYLLSKHYDINGLIPIGLANDATGLNIY